MTSRSHSFYIKGEDNRPLPKINYVFEKPRAEKIKKWTQEQKEDAKNFLNKMEKSFEEFKQELMEALTS
jgi:arsenate reductase-like glutaredoxin family protein